MSLKIIYIDDEPELCENFIDTFSEAGISILTFTDANSAIAAAKKTPPDLIFLDYRLPGTNGDKVAQLIDPSIPKYLITGDIAVATTYNFQAVFPKPYDKADISKFLHQFTRIKRAS